MTLRDNQSSTKLLRATIIAAIIIGPRHCLAILIAAHFLPRLARYNTARRNERNVAEVDLHNQEVLDPLIGQCQQLVREVAIP
ncbi:MULTISPECIES: hypothetical protein [unclassified Bradyrhizobium]|uniref:hypothetical protein n=1 Tax=unclassified Bradyrhizobium TaxID=2631580 RepID=UPI001CD2CED2|nr:MULTISPECIES: hypothetical protein [unclassified Bradyrhizobium]MCA1384310.1 hypothetical protein [Bradyrhizobium sp. BRP05]MCA1393633.1 hypothetical protein [Bradyrhizobium sp. IC3123]MCA1421052.1 hypothetical protein [Bradyrhizobium sp. BRP23]MCA1430778.1 hypothetical protein [Bradyrhizobium sp. NBAIM16]MCA1479978.1 hypothetical protein [Bradyrhizobium sp. NBAIM08]